MATDPVEQITHIDHSNGAVHALDGVLERFATYPPSVAAPYLTVCLDWTPDGTAPGRVVADQPTRSQRRTEGPADTVSNRPARRILTDELDRLLAGYEAHTPALESLTADRERLFSYLDDELDASISGLFVVACSAQGIFEAVPLGYPVPTSISVGPTPNLSVLARAIEDNPTFAVLVADQKNANLLLFSQRAGVAEVQIEGSDYPRKQMAGGWSQRRFQARADERVAAFARTVAAELRTVVEDEAIDQVILAGDEVIMSALKPELHETVSDKVLETISLDIRASESDILAAAEPIVIEAERRNELEAVEHLADRVGSGNRAVTGIDDVLHALQQGAVDTLILNDDFESAGWADFGMGVLGSGLVPSLHPTGGDPADLVPVDLDEQLIRLAIATGATVEIVRTMPMATPTLEENPTRTEAAVRLDEFGGIGALLRFDPESTADDPEKQETI
ncbi:MAG: hypothetical protein M3Y37_02980 [Chloroflexota bacterium]|nr:hypothetical protein [Chloroflexota bacterium]